MGIGYTNKSANRYALIGVEIGLGLLLMYLLAKMVVAFIMPVEPVLAPKLDVAAAVETVSDQSIASSNILGEFDFFHRNRAASNVAPVEASVAETTLNLKVFGMRADLGGTSSSAIIQTPDLKQTTYYIGEEIIPGVILQRVEIDYVILDRNGVNERLSRQGRTEDETKLATNSVTIESATIAFKASEMINNLRFYPQREGREVIGYRVLARRGNTLEAYGFKQNDIITSINGADMTQARVNLPNLWKNFKLARYASIQVLRNGSPVTIEVSLK